MDVDLLVTAGRVVCPATGWDGPGAVAVRAGRIVEVGVEISGSAERTLRFPDGILLPGLIDMHTHAARDGSFFGVDPDATMLSRGTTTAVSQGDAGAIHCAAYLDHTIHTSRTRVRLALNLSKFGESTSEGCFANLEDADVEACVEAVQRHREHLWGIAVNLSHHACGGSDPREILSRALAAAERTGLPLLLGMRRTSDVSFHEQLSRLRAGDVVTYCFRRTPHCIVEGGRVVPAVRHARERGVLFDVGHGTASFSFEVAEAAIQDGFLPDTVSTDLQARHLDATPTHHLPLVMSKLHAAGMPEAEVFAAVTQRPARILRPEQDIGSLRPGSCADLAILRRSAQPVRLADPDGQHRTAKAWEPLCTIRAGEVIR